MLTEKVTEQDVAEVVGKWTGIPVSRLMEGEVEKLIHMEERLHERVIGQDEAVEAVASALRRSRAGLSDPNRPIGSFLFLGPTGVGKTELARALAEFMFDSEGAITRIDMSEYMEKHAVSRLIGAPPGYVGYDEGGQLTEAVRRRPYAVILLDEIEKAHPDVFNVLLQILDDGRLTDGKGRTVDFTNTVLIMTSNVGSAEIASERIDETIREKIQAILTATFKPEFLNRIDETVIFHRLSREDITRIVDVQVAMLTERVRERGIEIELTDDARTAARQPRLRPDLRRPPAQAGDPEAARRPPGAEAARGRVRRGRHRPRRRRRRRADLRAHRGDRAGRRLAARSGGIPHLYGADLPRVAVRADARSGRSRRRSSSVSWRSASPSGDHDHYLGRRVGPQRVLGRAQRIAVADPALRLDPGGGERGERDGEQALALEASGVEVVGPAVEQRGAGRGDQRARHPPPAGRDRPSRRSTPAVRGSSIGASARTSSPPGTPGPGSATSIGSSGLARAATTTSAAAVAVPSARPSWPPTRMKPRKIGTTTQPEQPGPSSDDRPQGG